MYILPSYPKIGRKRLRITPKKFNALHSLALTLLMLDANGVCVCITKDFVTATVRTLLLSCTAGCQMSTVYEERYGLTCLTVLAHQPSTTRQVWWGIQANREYALHSLY